MRLYASIYEVLYYARSPEGSLNATQVVVRGSYTESINFRGLQGAGGGLTT